MRSSISLLARRPLCTATPSNAVRMYRFAHIKLLRALLRVKAVQLAVPVTVGLPTLSVMSSGGVPTLEDGGLIALVIGTTLGLASTISWYCQRLVGELTWIPARTRTGVGALQISTLSMWGDREDRVLTLKELHADGFISPEHTQQSLRHSDFYPAKSFVPLEICGKTYIFVWGKPHVPANQVDSLASLLLRNTLPAHVQDDRERQQLTHSATHETSQ